MDRRKFFLMSRGNRIFLRTAKNRRRTKQSRLSSFHGLQLPFNTAGDINSKTNNGARSYYNGKQTPLKGYQQCRL